MNRTIGPRRAARGSTLVQLLVGSAVGLTLAAGLSTFFIQGSRSSREDINVAQMLNELSYAASRVGEDLEMAGFWAQVHDPSIIDKDASLAITTDCGAAANWYTDLKPLQLLDNPSAADVHAAFPCIATADAVDGSDVIAVKRVLGRIVATDTSAAALVSGKIYLRTHDKFGRLYLQGGSGPASVATPYRDWEYAPVIYYVQKYTVSATESPLVPSLCRMVLRSAGGGAPAFTKDCIAQGIENLQIEVGIDTDEDGGANYFTSSPTSDDLNYRASTARLYLLARSARRDVDYVNPKTYQIGNMASEIPATSAPASEKNYHRKTLSTEVALRNPRALQGVAVQ